MRFTRQLDNNMDSRKGAESQIGITTWCSVGEAIGTPTKESWKDPTEVAESSGNH